mmetsp:Transcript_31423/g.65712  ORF Transcript_31423/g.65712 Transcript_31423/m.65712 type:complete len:189 (+) Transcript_31423:132-698(+)|eukprot:CAMPEP_0171355794 /NCGR_PEP_ID=MMETSP0878-20121228/45402_1 /TAXON_ID=67004 /ORGANISM="Thalassiosira weissflogii, Strain CCMP1336" /LENGTH=188 /DNA_ID=CAMNT_0011861801 /DNA_START=509 /DNA_END=1075 /DNA_ORIENTATION=+
MAIQRSNIASNANASINNSTTDGNTTRPSLHSNNHSHGHGHGNPQAQFNPRLILAQIISLQAFHYFLLGILFQINHVLFATTVTVDRIFTAKYLDVWSAIGWVDNAAILISSILGSILLVFIVEKSKKCLDFSVTLFLIHILICSIYGGFPLTWDWWIIHILGMIVMVVLGEYLCSKRELSDIPLLVL